MRDIPIQQRLQKPKMWLLKKSHKYLLANIGTASILAFPASILTNLAFKYPDHPLVLIISSNFLAFPNSKCM